MAKSPSRIKVAYANTNLSLASLLANTLVGTAALTPSQNVRLVKFDWKAAVHSVTSWETIVWGIADGDLTDAEIEEALESGGLDFGDKIAREKVSRAVFPLGILGGGTAGKFLDEGTHEQPWTYLEDKGFKFWALNVGTTGFTAGGQTLEIFAKLFLVPL